MQVVQVGRYQRWSISTEALSQLYRDKADGIFKAMGAYGATLLSDAHPMINYKG